MPRQNFISRDFFVDVSENEARSALLCLTQCSPHIKFIKENVLTHAFRFLYQPIESKKHFQIDISLLPLDNTYTQVMLHVAYTNGQELKTDAGAKTVMVLFEQAIQATLQGDISSVSFSKVQPTTGRWRNIGQLLNAHMANWFFTRKKGIANL